MPRVSLTSALALALTFAQADVSRADENIPPAPAVQNPGDTDPPPTVDPPPDVGTDPLPMLSPSLPSTTIFGNSFPRNPLTEDTLLTPDRTESPRSLVGSSVTVISREQIQRSGQRTVLNVLRRVPGLNIVQSGGPGQTTSAFMRGANSNHTKVLLDGVPLNDPTANRAFNFANLTLDNVERIEVLRGPQSTLYGSNAIGGVINVITRRGSGPAHGTVSAYSGSFDTWNTSASISGGDDVFYYSFAGSYFETDGFSTGSRSPGNVEDDGYLTDTFSGRLGAVVNDDFDIDYTFRYQGASTQFDPTVGGIPQDGPDSSKYESFFMRLQMRQTSFDDMVEQKLGFNYTNYNRHSFLSGFGFFAQQFNGDTRKIDYQANLNVWDDGDIADVFTVGAEYLQEDSLTANTFSPAPLFRTINDRSAYIQNRLVVMDNLSVTAGARWDYYSSVGSAKTYRTASRYILPDEVTSVHASLGTGFHAPTVNQLFDFGGNPMLRPEESKGWDIGVERELIDEVLTVDATYYRNDINNLIVFDFTTFALQNVDAATTTGVELTGDLVVTETMNVSANYTYADSTGRDPNSGVITSLLRRPNHTFSVTVDQSFLDDRAHLFFGLTQVGQRTDVNPVFGGAPILLDNYIVGNLSLQYLVSDDVRLFARVDNVFDEDYEEINGFQTPRVSAYAGFEVMFGGSRK